jgi:prepilin-type N-terminal cleavage/methylation domain-containing protein
MHVHRRSGFSFLELLIALLLFALVVTGAAYIVNLSRASSRDAKRISDVSVLRSALSQYWLQKASYPLSQGIELGKPGTNTDVLTVQGFSGSQSATTPLILQRIPTGSGTNEFYYYTGTANGYSLRFTTERETAYGPAGVYYAHAAGVDQDGREK